MEFPVPIKLKFLHIIAEETYLYRHVDIVDYVWPILSQLEASEFPEFADTLNPVLELKHSNNIEMRVHDKSGFNVEKWELATVGTCVNLTSMDGQSASLTSKAYC